MPEKISRDKVIELMQEAHASGKSSADKVVQLAEEAQAMESKVLEMLEEAMGTTQDPKLLAEIEHHKTEIETHERSLKEWLEARSTTASHPASGALGASRDGRGEDANRQIGDEGRQRSSRREKLGLRDYWNAFNSLRSLRRKP